MILKNPCDCMTSVWIAIQSQESGIEFSISSCVTNCVIVLQILQIGLLYFFMIGLFSKYVGRRDNRFILINTG